MTALMENKITEVVPRQEIVDYCRSFKDKEVEAKRQQLLHIWSFKRKRHPTGSLNNHEVRICYHRGQHELGVNYWDTCDPVVA